MSNKRKIKPPEPEKVTAGFVYEDEMKSSFVLSFIRMLGFDAESTGRAASIPTPTVAGAVALWSAF